MTQQIESQQRRRVRKRAYIKVKNILNSVGRDGSGAVGEVLVYRLEQDDPAQKCEIAFLHSKKRLAISGCLATVQRARHEAILKKVVDELEISHPIPKSAYRMIGNGECAVAADWVDKFDARHKAGEERMALLSKEPGPAATSLAVTASPLFGAFVSGVIDAPEIGLNEIIEFVALYRSQGESTGSKLSKANESRCYLIGQLLRKRIS